MLLDHDDLLAVLLDDERHGSYKLVNVNKKCKAFRVRSTISRLRAPTD
jgi:hypothetical protein